MSLITPDKLFYRFSIRCLGMIIFFPVCQLFASESHVTIIGIEKIVPLVASQAAGIPMKLTGNIQHLVDHQIGRVELEIDLGRIGHYDLQLDPFSLYADNFKIKEVAENRSQELETPLPQTYKGIIKNDRHSQVRLTISDNYFSGFIQDGSGHCVYLEHQASDPSTAIQIRIHSNDDAMERFISHTHDYDPQPSTYPRGIQHPISGMGGETVLDTGLYTTEIALIADYEAYSKANSSFELANELISILNYMDAYYNQLNIRYSLVELIIFKDSYSGEWPETTDAGLYLRAMDNWVAAGGVSHWHDLATLWTGREIGYSYAWVNTVGQFGRHHLVEFWGMGDTRWLANFQSHEAGHNWGASHVAHDRRYIMSPYIYDGILEWNDTTVVAFQGFLQNVQGILDTGIPDSSSLLVFGSPQIVADDNFDGLVDPGERIELEIEIKNLGIKSSATSRIHLEIMDNSQPWITVVDQLDTISSIEADSSIRIYHTLQINEDIPIPHIAKVSYSVADNLDSIWYHYSVGIGQQAQYKVDLSPVELVGNSNGKFDPGERVSIVLDLMNDGDRDGEDLIIRMTPDPRISQYLIDYDTLFASSSLDMDERGYLSIPLTILPDFPTGEKLGFQLKISDSQEITELYKEYVVGLPENHLYFEDFEYHAIGNTSSGWRVQTGTTWVNAQIGDTISVFEKDHDHWLSAPFDGDRSMVMDQHWAGPLRLISPLIDLTEVTGAELNFTELRGWDNYSPQRKDEHYIKVFYGLSPDGPWNFLTTIPAHEDNFQNWQELKNIDLSPALGQKVYISLYTFTQHYYWRIDNLAVLGTQVDPIVLPEEYAVANYPNPFNYSTNIIYRILEDAQVRLELFNSRGQLVAVLVDEYKSQASHQIRFEAVNLASGVYFCRLLAGESSEMTKMLLLK